MRLFYICPIQALYMIKNFGVKLEVEIDDETYDFQDIGAEAETVSDLLELFKNYPERIYVEKESEVLFEPQEEDIGLSRKGELTIFNEEERWEGFDCSSSSAMDASKIILREGKQFFAPEVEND